MLEITYVYYLQWIGMEYSDYTVKLFIVLRCDWMNCVKLFYSYYDGCSL